jgi:hypothetical protein
MGAPVYTEQYSMKTHLHPGWDSNPCLILHRYEFAIISELLQEGKTFKIVSVKVSIIHPELTQNNLH